MTIEEAVQEQLARAFPCAGPECDKLTIVKWHWKSTTQEVRNALKARGCVAHERRGLCYRCSAAAVRNGTLDSYAERPTAVMVGVKDRFDIPSMWTEILDEGGSIHDLAGKLEVTSERARQLLVELELPTPKHGAKRRLEERLEEITFLHSCGSGTHEIAVKLGVTDAWLIAYVADLRDKGLTTINLQYADKLEQVQLTNA